ncbi:carboxypeptidase M isoform X2 [Salminus brasiliensis]|uniref:carboxypeptidase M isoform X2 n=1 Tax=Salminus brasiliensis TaxID=930266 RepID=UPI003B832A82
MLFPVLFCLWITPSSFGLEFRYHNSVQVGQYLTEVSKNYSDFTHLHSIGQSVEGRELWVLILGQNPRQHRTGIPEFKYVGNMHGNEVVGRVLLLQLIDYLTKGYLRDPLVTRLLNSSRVHILPSMNPDGFESSGRDCLYSQGRFNKNGVDLNRNFPDAFSSGNGQLREKEVVAVMEWLKKETFVLSANLHGGAVVASYPYDNSNRGSELQGSSSVSPDNDVFIHLAKTYSLSHSSMHKGDICYDSKDFTDGITNGYSWYPLEGLKGQVLDSNGSPVQNASVEVQGRRNLCPFMTDRNGEYFRLLLPGNYTITVTHPGHEPLTETVSVPYGPDRFSALSHNFQLQKLSSHSTLRTTVQPTCVSSGLQYNHGATLLPSAFTALTALLLHRLLLS